MSLMRMLLIQLLRILLELCLRGIREKGILGQEDCIFMWQKKIANNIWMIVQFNQVAESLIKISNMSLKKLYLPSPAPKFLAITLVIHLLATLTVSPLNALAQAIALKKQTKVKNKFKALEKWELSQTKATILAAVKVI